MTSVDTVPKGSRHNRQDAGRPPQALMNTVENAPRHSRVVPAAGISASLTQFLATAVAIVALNLYASQPLIEILGPAFGMSTATASLVTTSTLLGYAAGLILLVPLIDLVANRRLIVWTLTGCVLSLVLAIVAPSASLFLAASIAIGFTSTVIQMLVPVAAALATESNRGRVVGNVMSGLMVGTLLSRPIASLVADTFGWRAVYGSSAVLVALMTLALMQCLPNRQPPRGPRYGALIASLGSLLWQESVLRRRGTYQLLLMGVFTVFWTAVALRLSAPPFHLGQRGIALFALAAAGAVIVAPIAGWVADRGWTRPGTWFAQGTAAAAMMLAAAVADGAVFGPDAFPSLSLALLAAAAFLLSLGVTGDQILGRHAINAVRPEARGRTNGLYTGLMFLGGSLGASVAGPAWAYGGWSAVCWIGLAFCVAALALYATERR